MYAALLADAGARRGLIGPAEVPRLWRRHLLNCAVLAPAFPRAAGVCDLGSGAGLPGLVLAIARPDLQVTVVDAAQRRERFLSECVLRLRLDNVEVVRARAEELHGSRSFEAVTARALAPLPRLLDWALPLVADEGFLLAIKGASATDEVAAVEQRLESSGWAAEVLHFGAGVVNPPTTAVRVAHRPRTG
jgi:16S rRNA (guanine527-N7)-methyltransferase